MDCARIGSITTSITFEEVQIHQRHANRGNRHYSTTIVLAGAAGTLDLRFEQCAFYRRHRLTGVFAGATLLVNGSYLVQHRQFGEMLTAFPVIILVTALVARLPRRLTLLSTLPLVFFSLQYMFLYAIGGMGLPSWFRALHAVNALVLFWITQYLAKAGWRLLR